MLELFEKVIRIKIAYTGAILLTAGAVITIILTLINRTEAKKTNPQNHSDPIRHSPRLTSRKWMIILISLFIIGLFWAPYVFRGQNTHVRIFDNMDCHIPQTKVLAESGKAFSLNPQTKLDNFINGLRLSGVDSGYNVMTWLFIIFPPFIAYALNDLIVRLIAFLGMTLLLSRYFITPTQQNQNENNHPFWLICGASIAFSLVPFYPAGGISIAGIPLLLWAFLNILNHKSKGKKQLLNYLIILFFPFYSKLALAGVFIATALFIIFLVNLIKTRKFNLPYFAGLALLTITYLFTHFHLVYSFIDPNFQSFREEIRTLGTPTRASMSDTIHNFIFDRVNEVGAHHLFVISAAAFAVLIGLTAFFKTRNSTPEQNLIQNKIRKNTLLISGLSLACLITAIMWGFKYWNGIIPLREKYQLLNAFDFSRFYWLNPFIWYLIFALSVFVISKIKFGRILAAFFIIGQIIFMFANYNWEYRHLLGIRSSYAGSPLTFSLTFGEYVSKPLFDEIDRYIGIPKKDYRIVSLGFHPGVSQFNGFYTLDIYTDVYPLTYKHAFQRIFEKELEKSEELQRGFSGNAKRCFLMISELHGRKEIRGMMFTRGITRNEQDLKVKHMQLNTAALKELGGKYIFSAVEIQNYAENGLTYEKSFTRPDSPWKIYLYKVI